MISCRAMREATTGTPMAVERTDASAAVIGNKILVVGGRDASGSLKTAEIYDPEEDSWTFVEALPSEWYDARAEGSALVLTILLAAGYRSAGVTK